MGLSIISASPNDACEIAALYSRVYPPGKESSLGDGYPFPQYRSPQWVSDTFDCEQFLWIVAKWNGRVVGCLGAAINISTSCTNDRIAELSGLIVAEEYRRRGIASKLMRSMCDKLRNHSEVVLSETRTANLGGYKASIAAGFTSIGFEPHAHNMLGRRESMIMLAKMSSSAIARRWSDYTTSSSAQQLGAVCLKKLNLRLPQARHVLHRSLETTSRRSPAARLVSSNERIRQASLVDDHSQIFRVFTIDQETYTNLLKEWGTTDNHGSGVVGLNRIKGVDPVGVRFVDFYFSATSGARQLGIACASVDLEDSRARILGLQTAFEGLQGPFLSRILELLLTSSACLKLDTIVVDMRADFEALHCRLQSLGFYPTVYYPALIETVRGRVDAVQFTRQLQKHAEMDSQVISRVDPSTSEIMATVCLMNQRMISTFRRDFSNKQ
jgi:GNAT superfamily N-acetyltransferase